MKKIDFYLKRGQIARDKTIMNLAKKYMSKARNNLVTMRVLSEINKNRKSRNLLKIPNNYDANEWVVICGYYAMYSAALSLLAKIGFRSKNHSATIIILEDYFVKKNQLNKEDLLIIKNAQFQKEEIENISEARRNREIAQYSVTKQMTKEIAKKIIQDAYQFVNKVELVINEF